MRSALILAGGASRRFGSPKAIASFQGRPMIAWVAAALGDFVSELLVSVADDGQGAEILRHLPSWDVLQLNRPAPRIIVDARKDRGPIEGLARGIQAARGDPILVAPCDAPLLRPTLYALLLDRLEDHDAAVPQLEAIDPVRAVYRRDAVMNALERHGHHIGSPSALVDRLRTAFVGKEAILGVDPTLESFLDINTLEDLRRASQA